MARATGIIEQNDCLGARGRTKVTRFWLGLPGANTVMD